MTSPAQRPNHRSGSGVLGVVLPLLLALALLAPVAFLFVTVWRANEDGRSFAARERHGVEYLRALGQVTLALADAQSAALTGGPVSREPLTRAVDATAAVDDRYGDELRSHERWTGLRAKIEALPDRNLNGLAAYTAYGEVTDLLLALHAKIRDSSGLFRDPESDSFRLQDIGGQELPEVIVNSGRLGDVALMSTARPATERLQAVAEITAARLAALAPAQELVEDLDAAVDGTESTKLGGNILGELDRFQRAMEELANASNPVQGPAATGKPATTGGTKTDPGTGGKTDPTGGRADPTAAGAGARAPVLDPARVTTARINAQAAAAELASSIFTELDGLIAKRADGLDDDRVLAVGAAGLAVLLTLLFPVGIGIARRRRRRRSTGRHQPPAGRAGPTDEVRRSAPPAERPEALPVGANSRGDRSGQWGRADAAR